MQYFLVRFAMVTCLLASLATWGQSIQNAPPDDFPVKPAPPTPVQPDAQSGSQKSSGEFSNVTNPDPKKAVPKDMIIVKGAWYGASDSTTPVPEGGAVKNNVFTDAYFGISYPLPADWIEKFTPPPPSETGSYVLAQIRRSDTYTGEAKGSIQFDAQDMFFTPMPAANARQFVNYSRNHLADYYQMEMKPTATTVAGQPFMFFAYWSPVAQLHWYVLATEIRCHTVEIVLMNRDPKTLEQLVLDLSKNMKLPAEANPTGGTGGGNVPVCIKDYASGDNVIERVDPVLTVRRYNAIPVRVIIDKEGKVKHIHFLSAFPEQQKTISEALKQWRFRPYEKDGQRLEVETGIMFGRPSAPVAPPPGAEAMNQ